MRKEDLKNRNFINIISLIKNKTHFGVVVVLYDGTFSFRIYTVFIMKHTIFC